MKETGAVRAALAAAVVALLFGWSLRPAAASRSSQAHLEHRHHAATAKKTERKSHSIWIDKAHQRLYAFSGHRLVLAAECSTAGRQKEWVPGDHRYEVSATPGGHFKILKKDSDYYSKSYRVHMLYSLFFMPGRAIHGTYDSEYPKLGTADSGGCVRLTRSRAAALYSWARVGDPVYIVHAIPRPLAVLIHHSFTGGRLVHQAEVFNRSHHG